MAPCSPGGTVWDKGGIQGSVVPATTSESTMFDTAEMQTLPATELTIVPFPQRDAWALVNRRGDTLTVGAYGDCLHRMHRLTASAA
jgi:hypothetical protein